MLNLCSSLGTRSTVSVSWWLPPDDPLGYVNAAEAVSDLGTMRKDFGNHLKLYRVLPVSAPIVKREDIEKHNAESDIEDFEETLVEEYILVREITGKNLPFSPQTKKGCFSIRWNGPFLFHIKERRKLWIYKIT